MSITDPSSINAGREIEVTTGRRAFAVAQAAFAVGKIAKPQPLTVSWHDSSVNPEDGSFAVVQQGAGLDDLIGEIVQVNAAGRIVYAYVLDIADVPGQISITRRLFLALNRLTFESLEADVAVVE